MRQNMNMVLEGQDFDTAEEFVLFYNKERLSHKDRWISYSGRVCGKRVAIKSFNIHSQTIRVDGVTTSGMYDLNVSQWKAEIVDAIGSVRRNPERRSPTRNPERRNPSSANLIRNSMSARQNPEGSRIKKEWIEKLNRQLDEFPSTFIELITRDDIMAASISIDENGNYYITWKNSRKGITDAAAKRIVENLNSTGVRTAEDKKGYYGVIYTNTNDLKLLLEAISRSDPDKFYVSRKFWLSRADRK